ncbi:hypothetical protein AArcSl_1888 [Halalkaliarchaeum desulfuricum]|uniref:Uncharacterized protein n=1 Tax=Halalkaliarchaeum desulfuricum TaxID=2055893 RepID=A0A343TK92_9EURY|nr:hypothetical protein [Halalkaliarchaeum desulfuricum]AUX09514.1 hypothetical protein AArcSl_1888 [Halalkaliarchaeum desulfuricum]
MHTELIIAKLVVIALGLLIAGQAYRSYRRGNGQPMLFVAIGFTFISLGSVLEGIFFELDLLTIYQASAIQTGIVAVGMLFVFYSLYGGSMRYTIVFRDEENQ